MKHLRDLTEKEVDLDKQEHPTVLDFDDNLPDTRRFVSKHKVDKHEDRAGNGDDVYTGSKVKYSLKTPQNSRMGRDAASSRAANEEVLDEGEWEKAKKMQRAMRKNPPAGLEGVFAFGKKDRAERKAFKSAKSEINRLKARNEEYIDEAKSYHNIEPHPTKKGAYIGYADGAWHVQKTGFGGWEAHKKQGTGYIRGRTLDDISSDLTHHSSKRYTKEECVHPQPKMDPLTKETIRMLIQKAEQNLGEKNKATTTTLLKAKSQNEEVVNEVSKEKLIKYREVAKKDADRHNSAKRFAYNYGPDWKYKAHKDIEQKRLRGNELAKDKLTGYARVKATEETQVDEKYIGFKALAAKVGPGAAAAIGRKKYGKAKFDHAAATGHKMKNMKPLHGTNESVVLDESKMRLLKVHSNGVKTAKVYRSPEDEEYVVKHFTNGKHNKNADYFTNDKEDAHGTAHYWTNSKHEDVEQIDEISRAKLAAYDKESFRDQLRHGRAAKLARDFGPDWKAAEHTKIEKRRIKGGGLAFAKMNGGAKVPATEEVEQIDELSKKKLYNYQSHAISSLSHNSAEFGKADPSLSDTMPGGKGWSPEVQQNWRKVHKRSVGIKKASERLRKGNKAAIKAIGKRGGFYEEEQKEQYKIRYSTPQTVGKIEEMRIFATSPELAKESLISSFKAQGTNKVEIHGVTRLDEISKDLANRYSDKSEADYYRHFFKAGSRRPGVDIKSHIRKGRNRGEGFALAQQKIGGKAHGIKVPATD